MGRFRHYLLKIKWIMAGRGRKRAEGTKDGDVSEDFREAPDSAEVMEESQVKRKLWQKKRRDADQAPLLAPRVEAETPSEAARESWPAGEMNKVVLPDEQAEEEHATRGVR
jgi:hypothetical protein